VVQKTYGLIQCRILPTLKLILLLHMAKRFYAAFLCQDESDTTKPAESYGPYLVFRASTFSSRVRMRSFISSIVLSRSETK
jgi:hypothetical protein